MKKLTSIIIVAMIVMAVHGQVKKDNLITLKTDTTEEANYKLFGKHLIDQGYHITGNDWGQLVTSPKGAEDTTIEYQLFITFSGSDIRITCHFKYHTLYGEMDTDWQYKSSRPDFNNIVYRDFIKRIQYGEVTFSRQ